MPNELVRDYNPLRLRLCVLIPIHAERKKLFFQRRGELESDCTLPGSRHFVVYLEFDVASRGPTRNYIDSRISISKDPIS